ncbi:hypothetical protein N7517_008755 [Penicillium concentricum]|uniref:Uncharacterized protein n=1 Tax=Penicillium concentricum TaxID=293559 RepID=A0A9W9RVM1_9EURO|nr:uncharacterized protein N7517_008755 [Penicillium concentricum]KAJ5365869.1 hypothetical protein N7517_008755 [Penicillium concentricum]
MLEILAWEMGVSELELNCYRRLTECMKQKRLYNFQAFNGKVHNRWPYKSGNNTPPCPPISPTGRARIF